MTEGLIDLPRSDYCTESSDLALVHFISPYLTQSLALLTEADQSISYVQSSFIRTLQWFPLKLE